MSNGSVFGPRTSERPTAGTASSSSPGAELWRTPSAEETGPRPETLSSEDGGPPEIGRRIYRTSPSGRRWNTQQTIGLQAELWPTPITADSGKGRGAPAKYVGGNPSLTGSAERWPTPQTSDSGGIVDDRAAELSHTPANQERAQLYRRVAVEYTNEGSPFWPTPRSVSGVTYPAQSDGRQGLSLDGRARRWPTPRADEREQRSSHDRSISLSRTTRDWPTPTAQDSQASRSSDGATLTDATEPRRWRTPRAIYGEHRGMEAREHLTGQAIEMWPTPDAAPRKTDFTASPRHAGQPTLSSETTRWGTPQSRDWRDALAAPEGVPTNSNLSRQAPRSGLLAPGSGTSGPGSSSGGPTLRPRLSSLFVTWLMGLPLGWVDPYNPIPENEKRRWQSAFHELTS